jgi:hypothetical protein
MGSKNNLLTQADSYRLHRWIDEHRPDAAKLTAQALANKIAEDTGLKVTAYNAQSARLALGIRVSEIRAAVPDGIAEQLAVIASYLCDQGNGNVPPEIKRIAGRLV